ncbi:MAG: hypothetical protein ACMUIL_14195 [bacterium]
MKKSDILFAFLPLIMAVTVLLCFTSPAISGEPLGDVRFYDVTVGKFSVVWEVDEESDYCDVLVYENNTLSPTLVSGYTVTPWDGSADPTLAQQRGIMQAVVDNLPTDPKTYYVQTRSRVTGSATNIDYPPFGSLLEVKTEPSQTASPPNNGFLRFILYEGSIASSNIISDGALVIVDAGGNYPVSGGNNGWPVGSIVNILFNSLRTTGGGYMNWVTSPTDHPIKIIAFGGKVLDNNIGQRIINTTFPYQLINPQNSNAPSCILTHIPTVDMGCLSGYNQLVLLMNQPPEFSPQLADTSDPLNSGIPAYYYGASSTIQICAYDPEGDPNIKFSLSGQPDWMDLSIDGDCVEITGTTSEGGIYRNIKLRVRDSDWFTASYTFTVIVTENTPETDYRMVLPVGRWSMISLPLDPEDPRADELFPDATIFKHTTTGYELLDPNDHMVKGMGYWIFLPSYSSGEYEITGYPIERLTITNVPSGWSMIGGCTYPATAASEGGAIRGIFGFGNRYIHLKSSDPLPPGMGFWINCSANATLNLDTGQ